MITPYRIAFGDIDEPLHWIIINYAIDGFFLFDIFIIFNSAYYDEEFVIVEDRSQIAKMYLGGWFLVDFLAIFPFDILFNQDNYGELARIARFGRMYKLIKMTRLLRILKIVKERTKLLKYLNDILKIGLGFERLFFFAMIFFDQKLPATELLLSSQMVFFGVFSAGTNVGLGALKGLKYLNGYNDIQSYSINLNNYQVGSILQEDISK